MVAQTEAAYKQAQLQDEADAELAKQELVSSIQLKRSQSQAEELKNRVDIETQRLEILRDGVESQLAPQEAEVDRRQTMYGLQQKLLDDLKVRAGITGVLQQVPVEVGQQVTPGTNLARVADPTGSRRWSGSPRRRPESSSARRPAWTRATASSRATSRAWTRPCRAARWRGVDFAWTKTTRAAHGPTSRWTGRSSSSAWTNVLYVGRPAFGQESSTVALFRLTDDGEAVAREGKLGRSSVRPSRCSTG